MTSTLHDTAADPDRPVPFTLTPKAHAALAALPEPAMECGCGSACAGYGWACLRCNHAFFGTPPGDGLCPACTWL